MNLKTRERKFYLRVPYGKIIDYWFSDTDKDKMLVQKMDEEDGESLSNTN